METRDFGFEVKKLSEAGRFEGLAAAYWNVDQGGDRIMPGAFTASLAERGKDIPLLWSHDLSNPVGLGKLADLADVGLHVDGEFNLDTEPGRAAYSNTKKKIVKGLSIGYTIPSGGAIEKDGVRELQTINLVEVSLVVAPMNPRVQISRVKSGIASIRDFQKFLRDAGFSKAEASRVASHGYKGLGMQEQENDILGAELDAWLKELMVKEFYTGT